MRWSQSDFALKGCCAGLLLYTAIQIAISQPPDDPSVFTSSRVWGWHLSGVIALNLLAGFGISLVVGLIQSGRIASNLVRMPHYVLAYVILENPLIIGCGLVFGLAWGVFQQWDPGPGRPSPVYFCLGGAILGLALGQLREFRDRRYRLALALVAGTVIAHYFVSWLKDFSDGTYWKQVDVLNMIGWQLLLGLPFFYLLCFISDQEETEAEAVAYALLLGNGMYLAMPEPDSQIPVIIAGGFFLVYAVWVLPRWPIVKYVIRGQVCLHLKQSRRALESFRRALELNPENKLAQAGMDAIHADIDIRSLDKATLNLLDPQRCLKLVRRFLAQKPSQTELHQAEHTLDLVEQMWPKLISHVLYYRSLIALHNNDIDQACQLLNDVLNPEGWFAHDAARASILFDAWQLVLNVHPKLKARVGEEQLHQPGRRMEWIGAIERQLRLQPGEAALTVLRQEAYHDLREEEYFAAVGAEPAEDFDYVYILTIGRSLLPQLDQWQRGCELLRMAAHGLPQQRPAIHLALADAYARNAAHEHALHELRHARENGLAVGVQQLAPEQRNAYFTALRRLGEDAARRQDTDEAIYNFSLATHDPASGVQTLRMLAEQYEKKRDIFNALRVTEKALCHDSRDADLLAKKDKYYYSVEPAELGRLLPENENIRKFFDLAYCYKKAKAILDGRNAELDLLDWADHLLQLALVFEPKNVSALVQKARIHLRRGERDEGLRLLEDIRELKPSGGEDTEAWYYAHKQLGKLYLDELQRADLAVPMFLEYLKSVGSGAETHFDLGRAYEESKDYANAIKHFRMVTAYESHPLAWDAENAIRRLKTPADHS